MKLNNDRKLHNMTWYAVATLKRQDNKDIAGFHMTSLKIQTTKLSILPTFYFHNVLEQLNTNFHTNFRFKTVLGFVIEYA